MHESEVAQINENDELLCCTDEAAIMCTKPTKRAACQLEAEQDYCSLQLLAESKKCESFCATNVCAHGLVSLAQLHTKLTAHACCLCAAVVCWQENVRMAAGSAVLEHRPSHREKASAIAAGGGDARASHAACNARCCQGPLAHQGRLALRPRADTIRPKVRPATTRVLAWLYQATRQAQARWPLLWTSRVEAAMIPMKSS